MENSGDQLKEYRSQLIIAEQKAQEAYDKSVLTLSGGAFGISFAFVDKFINSNPNNVLWLLLAWSAWSLSIISILFSFFFSNKAMRKAIEQVDSRTIYNEPVGGHYSKITSTLNVLGGLFFLMGAIFIIVFVCLNT